MHSLQVIRAILSNTIPEKIIETFFNNMACRFNKVTGYVC